VAQGDVLGARGDWKSALARYDDAIQTAPNAFRPYLHAALAAVELKDTVRAKGFVETAGQLRPGVAEVLSVTAMVQKASDPKSASRLMQQAMEQAPEEPAYPYQLGVIFMSMGAPLEAIDVLKKATALDPDYVDAYYVLAKVQRDLGRQKDARQSLDDAVRIDPKRADAWLEIADLLSQQDDDAGALRAYEKALKADAKNPASVCAMGETLVVRMGTDVKNLKRGIEVLENCVKLQPKHASAWKTLGNAYKTLTPPRKKEALRAYRAHMQVNPDDIENLIITDLIKDLGG
jgi:tetratricopeptide (TPR) repeat protein